MATYVITVSGCDDSTVIDIELTDAEAATVTKVAELLTAASTYGCEPSMRIAKTTHAPSEPFDAERTF